MQRVPWIRTLLTLLLFSTVFSAAHQGGYVLRRAPVEKDRRPLKQLGIYTGPGPGDGHDALERIEDEAEEELEHASQDVATVPDKVARVNEVDGAFFGQLTSLKRAFLQGLQATRFIRNGAMTAIGTTVAWFFLWYVLLYETDRLESTEEAEPKHEDLRDLHAGETSQFIVGSPRAPSFEPGVRTQDLLPKASLKDTVVRINPDFVFVFYHPAFKEPDGEAHIPKEQLMELFESQQSDWALSLTRLYGLATSPPEQPVTMREARLAVMKDVHDLFSGSLAFDVYLFSSIDDDQVFLCVTMLDPDVVYHHCHMDGTQIQLVTDIAERMGIGQPSALEDCASLPPTLPLDKRFVERLQESSSARVAGMSELYGGSQFVAGSSIRVRHIYRELTAHFNTMRAKDLALMCDFFPSHHRSQLARLRASWVDRFWSLSKWQQPIHIMAQYFGERLAFIFAWHGHYCKLIFALCVPALAAEITLLVSHFLQWYEWDVQAAVQLAFSYILVFWGVLAFRLWEQEQSFFLRAWSSVEHQEHAIMRPDFVGTWQPSTVDSNMREKSSPQHVFLVKRVVSGLATGFCALCVVVCIHTWFHIWHGEMRVIASLVLVVQIKVFEEVFNAIAEALTNWENHKFQTGHYNSYATKLFAFYFINYYYPFIHIMFFQRWSKAGCPPGGCLYMLRMQLYRVYITLVLVAVGEVIWHHLRVIILVWYEARLLKRRRGANASQVEQLTMLEKQAKFGEFKEREQIELMVQLVASLGFVLLFGAVAPATVVLCAFVFAFQLRCSAFLVTHDLQRPFPWNLVGIGPWMHAIQALGTLGIGFTAFVLVTQEGIFEGTDLTAKLTGCLIFVLVCVATKTAITVLLPCPDGATRLLELRRKHVVRRINEVVLTQRDKVDHDFEKWKAVQEEHAQLTPRGAADWEEIPHLKPRKMRRASFP